MNLLYVATFYPVAAGLSLYAVWQMVRRRLTIPKFLWPVVALAVYVFGHSVGVPLRFFSLAALAVTPAIAARMSTAHRAEALRAVSQWGSLFAIVSALLAGGRVDIINPNLLAGLLGGAAMFGNPLVAALGLAATQSRGVLLGFGVALAWRHKKALGAFLRRYPYISAAIVGAGVFGLFFLRPDTVLARVDTWGAAVNMFLQNPIMGAGFETLRRFFDREHADSLYLSFAGEGGALGLGLLLTTMVTWARRLKPGPAIETAILFAVWGLVDDPLYFPGTALVLGLAIADGEHK